MKIDEIQKRVLLLVSAAVYGIVCYLGILSQSSIANRIWLLYVFAALVVYQEKNLQQFLMFIGCLSVFGWLVALAFQDYVLLPSIVSAGFGLGMITLLVMAIDADTHNKMIIYIVFLMIVPALLTGVTLYLWLSFLHQILPSLLLGGVGCALVLQGFIWVDNGMLFQEVSKSTESK